MNKKFTTLIAVLMLFTVAERAHSAGFALIEQSVSAMGNAYAGGAAVAEDASTVFFNPAGMMKICNSNFVSGQHIVVPVLDYDDKGSKNFKEEPLTGNDGRDGGEAALVGHSYFVKNFDNCWAVGLGVGTPFGLATDYKNSWKGRYHAIRSQILTININPSIAYRFNRCWSIGAGLNVMYLHAKLSNAVDFGGILTAGEAGELSQQLDGKVFLKGNSWGYGGNIGVLWEPTCRTRFGVHYRSEIKHRVKGSERFKDVPSVLSALFHNTRTKSDITFPSSLSFSGYHEFNDCWAVLGDVTWFKWNVLKRLRFKFNNPLQPDGITTLKWQNSVRYSLGATYSPNACWKYRVGLAYDETPTPSKKYRTPRVPDEDRFWTTIGVGYDWNCCMHFDFGYAKLFAREPKIEKTTGEEGSEDFFRGALKGKYDTNTDIISFQLVYSF